MYTTAATRRRRRYTYKQFSTLPSMCCSTRCHGSSEKRTHPSHRSLPRVRRIMCVCVFVCVCVHIPSENASEYVSPPAHALFHSLVGCVCRIFMCCVRSNAHMLFIDATTPLMQMHSITKSRELRFIRSKATFSRMISFRITHARLK